MEFVNSPTRYARQYDQLPAYHPYYRELHAWVQRLTGSWKVKPGESLADLGAGTGNYSLALARQFPEATVLHIDKDSCMNARADRKRFAAGIINFRILELRLEEIDFNPEAFRGLLCIHALYELADPQAFIKRIFQWLKPGGQALLVNQGRVLNLMEWQLTLGWHLVREYGWWKTLDIYRESGEIKQRNIHYRQKQLNGQYWTHTHDEFCTGVAGAGFDILKSGTAFRGYSDWVLARRP